MLFDGNPLNSYFMSMKRLFFAFSVLMLTVNAFATFVAVLETGADGIAKDSVPLLDRQYLTNVLREQAVKELPAKENFTIMTRENILQMLPPGKAIEDCEGSCLVETGKNIAADYICQARVGRFGTSLTLSAELYETAGNKLIASFNGRGQNVEELLVLIENKSHEFFNSIREMTQPAETSAPVDLPKADKVNVERKVDDKVSKVGESVPANVDASAATPSKKGWCRVRVRLWAQVACRSQQLHDVQERDGRCRSYNNELPRRGLRI